MSVHACTRLTRTPTPHSVYRRPVDRGRSSQGCLVQMVLVAAETGRAVEKVYRVSICPRMHITGIYLYFRVRLRSTKSKMDESSRGLGSPSAAVYKERSRSPRWTSLRGVWQPASVKSMHSPLTQGRRRLVMLRQDDVRGSRRAHACSQWLRPCWIQYSRWGY
jgi:hypothetical protein